MPKADTVFTLRKARAIIDKGWAKYQPSYVLNGRLHACSVGAINLACGFLDLRVTNEAFNEFRRTIYGNDGLHKDIVPWNDAKERTHAEVQRAFDATIARVEGQPLWFWV